MSSNPAPDPAGSGDLDDELAALLAGGLPIADEPGAVEQPRPAEDGYGCGFDPDGFVEEVRNSGGVWAIDAMIDVPLEAFLEAARHDSLQHLSISSDDVGQPFLTGVVVRTAGPVVFASASLS